MSFSLASLFGKKKDSSVPPTNPVPTQSDQQTPPVTPEATGAFGAPVGDPTASFGDSSQANAAPQVAPTTFTEPSVDTAQPTEPMIGNEVNSGVPTPVEPMTPPQSPASALMGEASVEPVSSPQPAEPIAPTAPQEPPVVAQTPAQPEPPVTMPEQTPEMPTPNLSQPPVAPPNDDQTPPAPQQ